MFKNVQTDRTSVCFGLAGCHVCRLAPRNGLWIRSPRTVFCLSAAKSGLNLHGYRGYGLPVSELISEGNIGLMQAVKKFDPDKGFRLATYAMWWIKAGIQEYVLRSWSLVKIGTTAAQKKLFFNLKKLKQQIAPRQEGDLKNEQVEEISDRLGVKSEEVVSMNRRMMGSEKSLNEPIKSGEKSEWQDWVVDKNLDQELLISQKQELDEKKIRYFIL